MATVGTIVYPTETTWQVVITDMGADEAIVTATSDLAESVSVDVSPGAVSAPAASLALTAPAPTVRALAGVPRINAPAASLALTAPAPTVRLLDLTRITVPAADLSLRAPAPNLWLGQAAWKTPDGLSPLPMRVYDGSTFRNVTPRLFNGSTWN